MHRPARSLRLVAAVAALLLPIAGCSLLDPDITPTGLPSGDTLPPAGQEEFASFYEQELQWSDCESGECADLEVPLDWEDPDGTTIRISVNRVVAKGDSAGALVVNPGGPGGSGVDYAAAADRIVSPQIRRNFDVVGFDPRGVGRSAPIDCLSDGDLDDFMAQDPTPDDAAERDAALTRAQDFADGCEELTGDRLAHVSTADAAKDMDVLRAALGQSKLIYLGKSYGTYLGATYAELFPERVGRMVLDGVIPPDLTGEQLALGQAKGFDTATRAWAKDCLAQDCPFGSSEDEVITWVQDELAQLDKHPVPGSGGLELTEGWATVGIAQAMYDEGMWSLLTDALVDLDNGDGGGLTDLGMMYADRDPSGAYVSNLMEALRGVNCLDRPGDTSPQDWPDLEKKMSQEAPIWGEALAWEALPCAVWPYEPAQEPAPIHAKGADPILVVGTTRDPATPYAWAQRLHDQLDDSALITHEGDGHTAYLRQNDCVDSAVDEFWLTGKVPASSLTCD